ncbi:MAG: TldD/PmbA family protein [Betaproteobacteria bacterium]|nr:TldD/PmbA family protein [Betaproteobacteria bacterium]
MTASFESTFKRVVPAVDFCSLRFVEETTEQLNVRQNVTEPPQTCVDRGVMISIFDKGGYGYAATSDLSESGLRAAVARAHEWARLTAGRSVIDYSTLAMPAAAGRYQTRLQQPALSSKREKIDMLKAESAQCKIDDRIVDWSASFWTTHTKQLYVTADGGMIEQEFDFMVPALSVTAFAGGEAQTRSFGGRYNGFCQQGGAEIVARSGFPGSGKRTAEEALALLTAPNCPSGKMDVLLMPDQMMLQIHESIGHPLELDRILGDERNYAGTSFVTLDMFGSYQYGSPLLNVTYDPTMAEQFASFAFDDDGARAEKAYVIQNGILQRPLGGSISQARALKAGHALRGVANARACSWNRAPIDRMANLNIEPGTSALDDMIASIERGVLMRTNVSWSIDDSRNKFQFGCEIGQVIENGKLGHIVKNPNYRGISATFWRSLAMVGNAATQEVMGTPFCGKGEPNQVIRVGHASPACKFANIDVFGAEA